jgi:hypothetical protein
MRTKNLTCIAIGIVLLLFSVFIEPEPGLPSTIPVHPFIYSGGSHSATSNPIANIDDESKKPSEKGHWVTKSFNVSCMTDRGLSKETYVIAAVGSQSMGGDDCFGSYLHISNRSSKYPVYFGLNGVLNDHLEPKQAKVIHLLVDQPKNKIKVSVVANLYLKYWVEESSTSKPTGR